MDLCHSFSCERDTCEEGASIEELTAADWPLGMAMVISNRCRKAQPTVYPQAGGPGLYKKNR